MNIWESGRESGLLDEIIAGRKTIEGRLNKGKFAEYRVGDIVKLRRDYRDESGALRDGELDAARVRIIAIRRYGSFLDMVTAEGFKKVIPSATSANEAAAEYDKYYSAADQAKYGVLAIEIELAFDWNGSYASGRDYSLLDNKVVDWMVSYVAKSESRHALDVGCGVGNLARQLMARGFVVTGVDPAEEAIKRALAMNDSVSYEVGDVSVASGKFNLITCKHVYRFIPNKVDFLRQVKSKLVSGGVLVIITPTLDRVVQNKPGIAVDRSRLMTELAECFDVVETREVPTGLIVVAQPKSQNPATLRERGSTDRVRG